jgi:hypothetical protein
VEHRNSKKWQGGIWKNTFQLANKVLQPHSFGGKKHTDDLFKNSLIIFNPLINKTMKSTFLVKTAIPSLGKTILGLCDVNSGEGLNDFRAGTQNGVVTFDRYGDCDLQPGDTVVLELRRYDEEKDAPPAETSEETEATEEVPTPDLESEVEDTPSAPQVFTGQVSIETSEDGLTTTVTIVSLPESEPVVEETADTQPNPPAPGINDTVGSGQPAAAEGVDAATDTDTDTQADPAAAGGNTNSSEAAGPVAGAPGAVDNSLGGTPPVS